MINIETYRQYENEWKLNEEAEAKDKYSKQINKLTNQSHKLSATYIKEVPM